MLHNDLKVILAGVDVPFTNVTIHSTNATIGITAEDIKGDLKEMVKFEAVPVMILLKNPDPTYTSVINIDSTISGKSLVIFEGLTYDIAVHKVAYTNIVNILIKSRRLSHAVLDDIQFTDISVNRAFATVTDTQTYDLRRNLAADTGGEKLITVPDGIFSPTISDIFLRKLIAGNKASRMSKPHHIYQYTLDNMLLPLQAEFKLTGNMKQDIQPYIEFDRGMTNLHLNNEDRTKFKEERKYDTEFGLSDEEARKTLNPNIYTALMDTLPGFTYTGSAPEGKKILDELLKLTNTVNNRTKYSTKDYSAMVTDYVVEYGGKSVPEILAMEMSSSYDALQKIFNDDLWKSQILSQVKPVDNSAAIAAYLSGDNNIFVKHRELYKQYVYTSLYMLCSMLGMSYFEIRKTKSGSMSPISTQPLSTIFGDINANTFEKIFPEVKSDIKLTQVTFGQMTMPLFRGMLSFLNRIINQLDHFFLVNSISNMKQFMDKNFYKVGKIDSNDKVKLMNEIYEYLSGSSNLSSLAPSGRMYDNIVAKVRNQYASEPGYELPTRKDVIKINDYRKLILDQLNRYMYDSSRSNPTFLTLTKNAETNSTNFQQLFWGDKTINNESYFRSLIEAFAEISKDSNADKDSFIKGVSTALHISIMEEIVSAVSDTFNSIVESLESGLASTTQYYNTNFKPEIPIETRMIIPIVIGGNAESIKNKVKNDTLPELNKAIFSLIDFVKNTEYDNSEAKIPSNFSVFDYKSARNINNYGLAKRWGSFDSLIRYEYYNSSSIFPTLKLQNFLEYQKMINNTLQSSGSTFSLATAISRMYNGMYYNISTPLNAPIFNNNSDINKAVKVHPDIFIKPDVNMFIPPKCNVMLLEDKDKYLSFTKATNVDKVIINHHQALELLAGVPSSEFFVMDIFQIDESGPITASAYSEYVKSVYTSTGIYITGKNLYDLEAHTTIDIAPQIDMLKRVKDKTTIDDLMSYNIEKNMFPDVAKSDMEYFFNISNLMGNSTGASSDGYLYSKIKNIRVNLNVVDDTNFDSVNLPVAVSNMSYRTELSPYLSLRTYKDYLKTMKYSGINRIKSINYDTYKSNINNGVNINYSRVLTAGFPNELSPFSEISKKNLLSKYKIGGSSAGNDFIDDYEMWKVKHKDNKADLERVAREYNQLIQENTDAINSDLTIFNNFVKTSNYMANGKELYNSYDAELEQALKQQLTSLKDGTLPFNINLFLYILLNHRQGSARPNRGTISGSRTNAVLAAVEKLMPAESTTLLSRSLGDVYIYLLEDIMNHFINMLFTIIFTEYLQTKISDDATKQKLFYFMTNIMLNEVSEFFSNFEYVVEGTDPDDFIIKFNITKMDAGYAPYLRSLLEDPAKAKTIVDYKTGADVTELTDLLQEFLTYIVSDCSDRSIQVTGLKNLFEFTVGTCLVDDLVTDKNRSNFGLISNPSKNMGVSLIDEETITSSSEAVVSHIFTDPSKGTRYSTYKSQYRGFLKSYPTLVLSKLDNNVSSELQILDPSVRANATSFAGIKVSVNSTVDLISKPETAANGQLNVTGLSSGPLEINPKFFPSLELPFLNNVVSKVNKGKSVNGLVALPTGSTSSMDDKSKTAGGYRVGQNYLLTQEIDSVINYLYCRGLYANFKYNVCGKSLSKTSKRLIRMLYDIKPGLMSSKIPAKSDEPVSNLNVPTYSPIIKATDYYKEYTFPVITHKDTCLVTSEFLNFRKGYGDIHFGNDYGFDGALSDQYIKDGVQLAAMCDGWMSLGYQKKAVNTSNKSVYRLAGYGCYIMFMPDYSTVTSSLPYTSGSMIMPLYIYAHCDLYRTFEIIYDKYKNNSEDSYAGIVEALKGIFENEDSKAIFKDISDKANTREYDDSTLADSKYQDYIKEGGVIAKVLSQLDNIQVKVSKGDVVGYMGASGNSHGPHLHLQACKVDVPVSMFAKGISSGSLRVWYFGIINKINDLKGEFKKKVGLSQYELYKITPSHPDVKDWKARFRQLIFDDRVLALIGSRPSTFTTLQDGQGQVTDQRDMILSELLNLEDDYNIDITKADFSNTIDAIRFYIQTKLLDEIFNVRVNPVVLPYCDPYFMDGGMPFAMAYKNDIVFTKLESMQIMASPQGMQQQLVFSNGISLRYMLYYYLKFMRLQRKTNQDKFLTYDFSKMPMFPFNILREYNQTLMNMEQMNLDYENMFGNKDFAFNWMDYTYIKSGEGYVKFKGLITDRAAFERFLDTFPILSLLFDRNDDTLLVSFPAIYMNNPLATPTGNPVSTSNIHGEDLMAFPFRKWNTDNMFTLDAWDKNFRYNGVTYNRPLNNGVVYRPSTAQIYSTSSSPYYESVLNGMQNTINEWSTSSLLFQDWHNIFLNIRNSFK